MTPQKEYLVTIRYTNYEIEAKFFDSFEKAQFYYDVIRKTTDFVTLSKVISSTDQKSF